MTHFNHSWTNDTPAIPEAIGDRYYAQDLNDDFNYLKHLPYEAILQGRTRGVTIPPNDAYNSGTHTLDLSGGLGVVALNTPVLDVNESFVVPPKTTSNTRYERVSFQDVSLTLPVDNAVHYIVATPTKRSLLQRTKSLLSELYYSRIKYDGIIAVQDTAPTSDQILVGLCYNDDYLLCKDYVMNQAVRGFVVHKWVVNGTLQWQFATILANYYNTSEIVKDTDIVITPKSGITNIDSANAKFQHCHIFISLINTTEGTKCISNGQYDECVIDCAGLDTTGICIGGGTYNSCKINFGNTKTNYTPNNNGVIRKGNFVDCDIFFECIQKGYGVNAEGQRENYFIGCSIVIKKMGEDASYLGNSMDIFVDCTIDIEEMKTSEASISGIYQGCSIRIKSRSANCSYVVGSGFYAYNTNLYCVTESTSTTKLVSGGIWLMCAIRDTLTTNYSNSVNANSKGVVLHLGNSYIVLASL